MLQFVGSAARVFTTLQEVKDTAILSSFLLATTLNGVIAGQVIWYNYLSASGKKRSVSKRKKKA